MILDTDVLIDILRKHPPAVTWFVGLKTAPSVSGIAALELAFGSLNKAELARVQKFLQLFPIEWPTEQDMQRALVAYSPLKLSKSLGLLDALIAATAVGAGETLATFNVKHFRSVPGLILIQPYKR